jgi:hypothetical protein
MASMNPEYYSDESNHGNYAYVTLEEMNNFISNYTGDGSILGKTKQKNNLSVQARN